MSDNETAQQDDQQTSQPQTPEQAAPENNTIEELAAQLQAAQAKADENYDLALRAKAEADNVKRRSTRDIENAHKYAVEKFANDLLAVRDSLEMGLKAACQDGEIQVDKLKEGTELTLKQMTDAFAKHGIEVIDPQGQTFDPEQHQAISMAAAGDAAPNSVLDVVQKGYSLNGRLIRPAMVVVAQANS